MRCAFFPAALVGTFISVGALAAPGPGSIVAGAVDAAVGPLAPSPQTAGPPSDSASSPGDAQARAGAFLSVPDSLVAGSEFAVVCSLPEPAEGATYAWDFNGDGKIDASTDQALARHTFPGEGTFTVVCRISGVAGNFTAEKLVHVSNFPTIVNAGGPYNALVKSPLTLEATVVDKDNRIVSYSWDFDNDNKYDRSSSTTSRTTYTFGSAGEYLLRLRVVTNDGRSTVGVARVTVRNAPPQAFAGRDFVSPTGRKVVLKGSGKDPDGTIARYEWDFDGDGQYDWSSPDTGYVEHAFAAYSRAVLRVTDAHGALASDTVRAVVCPEGMVAVRDSAFCIDLYEWPNRKGAMPARGMRLEEARLECSKAGKRLCTADEWERACRGPRRRATEYPYGEVFIVENCNSLGNSWSKNRPAKSGEFPKCRSRFGAYDMSGNMAELTEGGYVYGGSWNTGKHESACSSRSRVDEGQTYFYAGFRCCK